MTEPSVGTRWRHKKNGVVYEVIAEALIQCSTARRFEEMFEDENWVVYRNVNTGSTYVRLAEEFIDGRFEYVSGDNSPADLNAGESNGT